MFFSKSRQLKNHVGAFLNWWFFSKSRQLKNQVGAFLKGQPDFTVPGVPCFFFQISILLTPGAPVQLKRSLKCRRLSRHIVHLERRVEFICAEGYLFRCSRHLFQAQYSLGRCGPLWTVVDCCGPLWIVVHCCGSCGPLVNYGGLLWRASRSCHA